MKKLFQVLANSSGACAVGFLLFEKLQTVGSKFHKINSTMDVPVLKSTSININYWKLLAINNRGVFRIQSNIYDCIPNASLTKTFWRCIFVPYNNINASVIPPRLIEACL